MGMLYGTDPGIGELQ